MPPSSRARRYECGARSSEARRNSRHRSGSRQFPKPLCRACVWPPASRAAKNRARADDKHRPTSSRLPSPGMDRLPRADRGSEHGDTYNVCGAITARSAQLDRTRLRCARSVPIIRPRGLPPSTLDADAPGRYAVRLRFAAHLRGRSPQSNQPLADKISASPPDRATSEACRIRTTG